MATAGPNSPGTLANDATAGTTPWSNASNAASSNNVYATVLLAAFVESQYLLATNFGFAIPSGATINGILVEVEGKSGLGGATYDLEALIVRSGVIGADNKAVATGFGTSDAYVSYGGAADLWSLSWTDSIINASDFGFAFRVFTEDGDTVSVDHIRITVGYTDASGVKHFQTLLGAGS